MDEDLNKVKDFTFDFFSFLRPKLFCLMTEKNGLMDTKRHHFTSGRIQ